MIWTWPPVCCLSSAAEPELCVVFSSVPVMVPDPPHEDAADETAAEHNRGTILHLKDHTRICETTPARYRMLYSVVRNKTS